MRKEEFGCMESRLGPSGVSRRHLLLGSGMTGGLGCLALGQITKGIEGDVVLVKAKRKPPDQWITFPTRTVRQLRGLVPDSATTGRSPYGGWRGRKLEAAGFFRARQQDGRWWLVDPDGYPYISVGLGPVSPAQSPRAKAAFKTKFGSVDRWAEETATLLAGYGFNCIGQSTVEELRRVPRRLKDVTRLRRPPGWQAPRRHAV